MKARFFILFSLFTHYCLAQGDIVFKVNKHVAETDSILYYANSPNESGRDSAPAYTYLLLLRDNNVCWFADNNPPQMQDISHPSGFIAEKVSYSQKKDTLLFEHSFSAGFKTTDTDKFTCVFNGDEIRVMLRESISNSPYKIYTLNYLFKRFKGSNTR